MDLSRAFRPGKILRLRAVKLSILGNGSEFKKAGLSFFVVHVNIGHYFVCLGGPGGPGGAN